VSQQKSPYEDIILFLVVVFIILGLAWVIWHFFSLELTAIVRFVRVWELRLVHLVYGDGGYKVMDFETGTQVNSEVYRKWLPGRPIGEVLPEHIRQSTLVGVLPLKMFFMAGMVLMGLVIALKGPGTHYHRRMGLETLMQEQAKSFPAIQPFLKFDPRKLPFRAPGQPVPAQLPLFSEQLAPEEWLAYHEVKMVGGQLDRNRAWQALALQLGRRWEGPEKLPLHAQGLYAVFALKHVRKRKDSEELLGMMSRCWSADKGFRPSAALKKKIRAAIRNPKVGGAMRKYADQHAYETTALARCLSRAREEGGVLAPAQFLWLRGQDRNLWYPLNNLGRKSYCVEAVGALVHYTNELIAGQKIPTPRFDEVITGFEKYMKSGAARVIPELDKKSGGAKYWK
jgi:intracellular multiplication protein IcmP